MRALALAAALLLAACSNSPQGGDQGLYSVAPSAPPASLAPSVVPGIGDGTFRVAVDIKPGTYRTRTPSPNCYWERLSGFSGALSDVIANDNTDAPAVVTIKATDAGFKSDSCAPWSHDLSAITAGQTSFGDGTYIVKTDMTPGTYASAGGTGCYWERLSGFGGTNGEILANDNVDGPTVVTIKPTDAGFSSNGCADWTRTQ